MDSEDIVKNIKKKLDDLYERIEKLGKDLTELLEDEKFYEARIKWREESKIILDELRKIIKEAEDIAKTTSKEEAVEILEEIRDRVKRVERALYEIPVKLRARIKRKLIPEIIIGIPSLIESSIEETIKSFEKLLSDLAIKSPVVSARIKRSDLEIVDQLVDLGIFKTRSEAIAYFIRKGIEASKEWIDKAVEQARKIRELQESIKRELGLSEDEKE